MIIVPFIPTHLSNIDLHESMGFMNEYLDNADYANLLVSGIGYSGIVDGRTVLASGLLQTGTYKATAWALVGKDAGKYMLKATREIERQIRQSPYKRIETPVLRSFKEGHRWMKILGFENETPNGMKYWGEDGKTYDMYARYKK